MCPSSCAPARRAPRRPNFTKMRLFDADAGAGAGADADADAAAPRHISHLRWAISK